MESDHVDWLVAQVRRERPDLDFEQIELIGRITRLNAHVDAQIKKSIAGYGLRVGELTLLITLRRAGAPFQLTPTALHRSMMVSSAGTTRRLDALERRGLIARSPDPSDRRGTLVGLTAEGRRLVDAAWAEHLEKDRWIFDVLADEERHTLANLLRKVLLGVEGPVDAEASARV